MTTRAIFLRPAALGMLLVGLSAYGQQGVWKSYTPPPGTLKGEFENNDPIGLASGSEIKADCSLSWTDQVNHKLYCFASGTSLQIFIEAPQTYIAKARAAWAKLHPSG